MSRRVVAALGLTLLAGCHADSRGPERPEIASQYPAETTALATEGGAGLPYYVGKDLRPVWKTEGAPPTRALKPFQFKDQKGRPIGTGDLRGKIAVVSFFYTECPGICPMTTENLKAVQRKFEKDDRFVMVSLSVNPEHDTTSKLEGYASKHGIDYRRWKLATGARAQIYKIARESFGADTYSAAENQLRKLSPRDFLHSESVYLIDGEQRLRGIYAGRSVSSLEELARDVEQLL